MKDLRVDHVVGNGYTIYRGRKSINCLGFQEAETTLIVHGSKVTYKPFQLWWPEKTYFMGR